MGGQWRHQEWVPPRGVPAQDSEPPLPLEWEEHRAPHVSPPGGSAALMDLGWAGLGDT